MVYFILNKITVQMYLLKINTIDSGYMDQNHTNQVNAK